VDGTGRGDGGASGVKPQGLQMGMGARYQPSTEAGSTRQSQSWQGWLGRGLLNRTDLGSKHNFAPWLLWEPGHVSTLSEPHPPYPSSGKAPDPLPVSAWCRRKRLAEVSSMNTEVFHSPIPHGQASNTRGGPRDLWTVFEGVTCHQEAQVGHTCAPVPPAFAAPPRI
jgi:hypothetical protein